MSLSACALSLLPLTMSYIAGTESEGAISNEVIAGEERGVGFDSIKAGFVPSAAFAAGEYLFRLVLAHYNASVRSWPWRSKNYFQFMNIAAIGDRWVLPLTHKVTDVTTVWSTPRPGKV